MKIEQCTVTPFESNCYILQSADGVVLIDPGGDTSTILKILNNRPVLAVLLTHGHYDHIGALNDILAQHTAVQVYIGKADKAYLYRPSLNLSVMSDTPFTYKGEAVAIEEGQFSIGGLSFKALSMPGHTPGFVIYIIDGTMFSGDVLFFNSIGRTDLPGGDWNVMMKSLARFVDITDDLRVLPGHGPETTLDQEKQYNPFLKNV